MNDPTTQPRSLATKGSWISLGFAIGCGCAFVVFEVIDETIGFAHNTPHGMPTGFLPRSALWVMWAGAGLAVIVGLASFVLIRRPDIASKAIVGIVVRSMIGIGVGLCACVVLWLYVGHRVIGF
jgi:ABC-type Mn2+/Zn2+ transport system permease subunit